MVKPFGIPPLEAIKLIRAKGFHLLPSFSWKDVWAETHAAAFTVAKSAGFNILDDVYKAVRAAQEGKLTYKDFLRELQPALEKKGWWGQKEMLDPLTGETVKAQLGGPRRLRTIYDVNLRQAEAAGKWARIQAVKAERPYLRYVAVMDSKTRDEHKAWHGLILPVDHPFWDTHFPPNDWGCRCHVQQVSESHLERWGLKVSEEIPDDGLSPWLNERTGEEMMIPQGVAPAFAHNAGKVALDVHAARALGWNLAGLAPEVAAEAASASGEFIARALSPEFRGLCAAVLEKGITQGRRAVVGALSPPVLARLAAAGQNPGTGAITLVDYDLGHLSRDSKRLGGRALNEAEIRLLPYILAKPKAILREINGGGLLYVYDPPGDSRQGKIVVLVDSETHLPAAPGARSKKEAVRLNRVKTAGLVDISAPRKADYEVIQGRL